MNILEIVTTISYLRGWQSVYLELDILDGGPAHFMLMGNRDDRHIAGLLRCQDEGGGFRDLFVVLLVDFVPDGPRGRTLHLELGDITDTEMFAPIVRNDGGRFCYVDPDGFPQWVGHRLFA